MNDVSNPCSKLVQDIPRVASRAVDEKIHDLRRQGKEVLKLLPWPDQPIPSHIVEAAREAALQTQCPESRGLLELRQGIAQSLHTEMGIEVNPETEVLITYGAMHGDFVSISSLVSEGDEVLVPTPTFFADGFVALARGRPNWVAMSEADEYRLDLEKLEKAITPKTKVLFLVSPHNPTGYVHNDKDLQGVADLIERHNLFVVSDESYHKMVYDGRQHRSLISLPQARERTVLVRSFTKSYIMPDWRVGYIVASAALIQQFLKVFEWMCLFGSYVPQKAAIAAMRGPQEWVEEARLKMQANRDSFYQGLSQIDGLSAVKPKGGPFFLLNISALGIDEEEFYLKLLLDYGVPTNTGKTLKQTDHLRIQVGAKPETLKEALERLRKAVSEVRK
ncbi:MAG: pyridoxal phosphate-dependent aminotransferase [Dehalococcoidia bacterium]|nr:MAG: pyridoxal phosphate-dependent aminotransferase [Dehalococcoidia bacterium]